MCAAWQRRRQQEVCGKPTQYNLQTLEYDWRELPNTHIQLPPRTPRQRLPALQPTQQTPRQARSPTPAPAPRAPRQEAHDGPAAAAAPPPLHLPQQQQQQRSPSRGVTPRAPLTPAYDAAQPLLPPPPPQQQAPQPATAEWVMPPWSHEELRRLLGGNAIEAQHSYLH